MKKNRGFTIVEMIVVIAIIGVLTLIAVPTFIKYIDDAQAVDRNALANISYKAALAYYAKEGLTESENPSSDKLEEYIDKDVKIVSGLGEPNCNSYGHYEWDKDNSGDKDEKMCVHIILEGDKYNNAGITSAADCNWIVIEMYDPNIDQQFTNSEKNIRYYKYKF